MFSSLQFVQDRGRSCDAAAGKLTLQEFGASGGNHSCVTWGWARAALLHRPLYTALFLRPPNGAAPCWADFV